MSDLARVLIELTARLATEGSLVFVTDYDGTLASLVADPASAWLPSEVREDLRLLARSPRVRVVVLSGRALKDLRARVGIAEVIYAGCHGLEVEGPDTFFRHPEAEAQRRTLEVVARALSLGAGSIPRALVEPKGLAVAVHYRTVPPRVVGRVQVQVERAIRNQKNLLGILRGKKVIEILPRVRWSKGDCALWIRDRVVPTLLPPVTMLYMGDDRTDELAFRALSGEAITIRVGGERIRTTAAYRLKGVTEVHRLLSALTAELRADLTRLDVRKHL